MLAFYQVSNCSICPNELRCQFDLANTLYCYNAQENNLLFDKLANKTIALPLRRFCLELRTKILQQQAQVCSVQKVLLATCTTQEKCTLDDRCLSNNGTSSRQADFRYLCPDSYPNYELIAPFIYMPIIWSFSLILLALVVWRRKFFPLRVKSIPILILQIVCGAVYVSTESLSMHVTCLVIKLVTSILLPLYVSFPFTRV